MCRLVRLRRIVTDGVADQQATLAPRYARADFHEAMLGVLGEDVLLVCHASQHDRYLARSPVRKDERGWNHLIGLVSPQPFVRRTPPEQLVVYSRIIVSFHVRGGVACDGLLIQQPTYQRTEGILVEGNLPLLGGVAFRRQVQG